MHVIWGRLRRDFGLKLPPRANEYCVKLFLAFIIRPSLKYKFKFLRKETGVFVQQGFATGCVHREPGGIASLRTAAGRNLPTRRVPGSGIELRSLVGCLRISKCRSHPPPFRSLASGRTQALISYSLFRGIPGIGSGQTSISGPLFRTLPTAGLQARISIASDS
jgi:hypothetical protein